MTSSNATKRKPAGRPSKQAQAARRRQRYWRWGVVVAVIAFGLGVFLVTAPGDDGSTVASGKASIGEVVPAIEMVDFDGQPVTLEEFRGTPMVINFWASWCPFCIAEMPDFETVSQRLGDDVVFLGVNLQDDRAVANQLVGETGVSYRLTEDPTGVVYGAFGGTAMPTTVFVDADGVFREIVAGQMSEEALSAAIARLDSPA